MLLLLRHGQTELNAERRLQGRSDPPLTELGRRQAAAAALAMRPAIVISSPLRRARDTAEAFGVDVVVDERWTEVSYGELEGMRITDVPVATWEAWRTDRAFRPPGGESLLELGARVRAACTELAAAAADQDVLVVSHVSPIKAAVAWALGVGDEASWRMFLDVASACRIRVDAVRGTALMAFNDRSHLLPLG
jgi:broad specificity phosphatase PhoE